MNRKKIKLMIATISVSQVINLSSIAFASINTGMLSDINYDYSNPIYSNGIDDTYVYDSTDSVITTKTGIQRTLPEVTGRYDKSYYPIPEVNRVPSEEIFELIKKENKEIMDRAETDIANGTLKKHIAADGQFYGTVPDDALGVEKKVYVNTNSKGLHSLAVYVPAGEVATVTLNDEALSYAKNGKVKIAVGMTMIDATSYGSNNNNENRMPYLGKVFNVSEKETKVGTPFGGMVYIDIDSSVPSGLKFEVDVKGVVDAPYFDLGKTTNEEWETAKNSPGVFAEIRTPYLRFVVPSKFIRETKNIEEALKFWTNTVSLSATIMDKLNRTTPMSLTFDQYITVGIAYATVGWWTCNLPPSWATNALDFNSLVSGGSWGLIHEINHHYQSRHSGYDDNWGLGPEFSEITNNALSTLSYILYTDIASYRGENGTDDWNKVADPYSSLKQQIFEGEAYYKGIPNIGNFMFSAFAHEIGPVNFANVVKSTYDGGAINGVYLEPYDYQAENRGQLKRDDRYDDMAYRFCVAGGRDYTWYIKNELRWPLKDETVNKIKALGYEEFIPVQTVYGVGEVGRETGRAFYVPSSGYTFDFEKSLVSPGEVTVVDVSQPKYGKLTKRADGKYDYESNPSMPENEKDQFILTVNVKKDGINQETKLNCIIGINYNSSKVEHFDITKWDIKDALQDVEQKEAYEVSSSSGMRIDTHYGNKLARSKGYFKVDESGEYEFQVFGDDNAAFRVHLEDGNVLESITEDYSSNANDAYNNNKSTHFNLYLEAGKAYPYTLIANNKDGIGWGDINIRRVGENSNWESIKKVFSREEDLDKSTDRTFTLPKADFTRPSILAGGNETTIKDIKVISHPIGVIPNSDPASIREGNPNNIVDNDVNTYFHSSYTDGNRTPFPHEYVFDLGDEKSFNNIEVLTRRSGDEVGVIGDYEIYISNEYDGENTNWTKVAEDNTRYGKSVSKDLKISLPQTTARYIKLKALNNRDNHNLTIIAEFKVSTETNVKNIIAQNSSFIQYDGEWRKESNGAFINGATYNTSNGYFMYAFEGSESNIYSATDVELEIRVDDGQWKREKLKGSLREPSITLKMPNEGKHIVEVRAVGQELALNMISTDGTFIKEQAPTSNPPVITGVDNIEIGVGKVDAFDKLYGVSYTDDKDLSGLNVTVSGEIGKPLPGNNEDYVLTYIVTDSDRNTTTVERVVTVTNQLPEIHGVKDMVIKEGTKINLKDGITATDKEDGNITENIKVIGTVEVNNPGVYDIEYEVTDSDGNVSKVKRQITVEEVEILPVIIKEAIDDKSLNLISGKGTNDEPAELEFNNIHDEKVEKLLEEIKKFNIRIEELEDKDGYTIVRFLILEEDKEEVKNKLILKVKNEYSSIVDKLNKFAGKEEILPPTDGENKPSQPEEPPIDEDDKEEPSEPEVPPTGEEDKPSNPEVPPIDKDDKEEPSEPETPPTEDEKPSDDISVILPVIIKEAIDDKSLNLISGKGTNDEPAELEFNNIDDEKVEKLLEEIKKFNIKIEGLEDKDGYTIVRFLILEEDKEEVKNKLILKVKNEYSSIVDKLNKFAGKEEILPPTDGENKPSQPEEPPIDGDDKEEPSEPEVPPTGGEDEPSNPEVPPIDEDDKEEPSEPEVPPTGEEDKPSNPEVPPIDKDDKEEPSEPEVPPTGGEDKPSNPEVPPIDKDDKEEPSEPETPPTEDEKPSDDISTILPPVINEAIENKIISVIAGNGSEIKPIELEINVTEEAEVDTLLKEINDMDIVIQSLERNTEYTIVRFKIIGKNKPEIALAREFESIMKKETYVILKVKNENINISNKLESFAKDNTVETPPSNGDDSNIKPNPDYDKNNINNKNNTVENNIYSKPNNSSNVVSNNTAINNISNIANNNFVETNNITSIDNNISNDDKNNKDNKVKLEEERIADKELDDNIELDTNNQESMLLSYEKEESNIFIWMISALGLLIGALAIFFKKKK